MHMLSLLNILDKNGGFSILYIDIFITNNRIGSGWEHGPGHYFNSMLTILQRDRGLAGSKNTLYIKLSPSLGPLLEINGHTIHGDPVEWRKVTVGVDSLSQHPAD